MLENIKLEKNHSQVCIWSGVLYDNTEKFKTFFKNEFNTRVNFLEEIKTKPDIDVNGFEVKDTGDRNDILFSVHKDDISHFSISRLKAGISWIEDVLADCNYKNRIYPPRIFDYVSWNQEHITFPE